MIELRSKAEHDAFVKNNPISLVQYATTWCGPCKALKPHVEKFGTTVEFPVAIVYVDVAERGQDISTEQEIQFVPVLRLRRPTGPVDLKGKNIMALQLEVNEALTA